MGHALGIAYGHIVAIVLATAGGRETLHINGAYAVQYALSFFLTIHEGLRCKGSQAGSSFGAKVLARKAVCVMLGYVLQEHHVVAYRIAFSCSSICACTSRAALRLAAAKFSVLSA